MRRVERTSFLVAAIQLPGLSMRSSRLARRLAPHCAMLGQLPWRAWGQTAWFSMGKCVQREGEQGPQGVFTLMVQFIPARPSG